MDDPIRRHPTRAEQLDILVCAIADNAGRAERVLDLGCGTGYVAHLLLERRPDLVLVGVDLAADALAQAERNLREHAGHFTAVRGDLRDVGSLEVGEEPLRFVYSCLTFHDLPHEAKRAAIAWSSRRLSDAGTLLVYDRIRLTAPCAFDLQRSIWRRIERVHGQPMRSAESYAGYEADLGPTNNPASLAQYLQWFGEAGLEGTCLHLHGNIAVLAASRAGSSEPSRI